MGNAGFRGRCESALTHAVTITAICTLLVNDLALKSLWPGAWATGKLSDLAWVVFAPPLLAFLLSFAARGNAHAQRSAFAAAYLGLPLLYAAFNTFEPVHDAITRGLSLASGRASGGPLDATDSLVIPFGMAAALWVWHRSSAGSHGLRGRAVLLVASLASLASVATSQVETELGITCVGFDDDGTLLVSQGYIVAYGEDQIACEQSVETPRGVYSIEGSDVVRTIGGREEVAYSAAYLRERGNMHLQAHATRHFVERQITMQPYSIAYDERTGNVVVAMGLQGIVVGTPDGRWTREAVGRFAPTDFSIVSKFLLLGGEWMFWLMAVGTALSFAALAMAQSESAPSSDRTARIIASVFAVIASIIGMVFYPWGYVGLQTLLSFGGGAFGLGLAVLVGAASYIQLRRIFQSLDSQQSGGSISARLRGGLLPVIAGAVGGMLALIVLSFFLWVQLGISLGTAMLSAIGLTALTAFILRKYLKGRMSMMPKPMTARVCPCGCGKMLYF